MNSNGEIIKRIKEFGVREFIENFVTIGRVRESGMAAMQCPFPWSVDETPSFAINVITGEWVSNDRESTKLRKTHGDLVQFVENILAFRTRLKWETSNDAARRTIYKIIGMAGDEEYFLKCKIALIEKIRRGERIQTRKPWYFQDKLDIIVKLPLGYDESLNALVFGYYDYNHKQEAIYISSKQYFLSHTPGQGAKTKWADEGPGWGVMAWPHTANSSTGKQIELLEGEPDTLTLILLGFNAVSSSGGAQSYVPVGSWATNKIVHFFTDKDDAGRAAKELAPKKIRQIGGRSAAVSFPDFPAQPDKTDISDYVAYLFSTSREDTAKATEEAVAKTIRELCEEAAVSAELVEPSEIEPVEVEELSQINSARFFTRPFRVKFTVITVENSAAKHLPSSIDVECPGPNATPWCDSCSVVQVGKHFVLRDDSRPALRLMDCNTPQDRRNVLHSEFGINSACKRSIVSHNPGKDVITLDIAQANDDERITNEIIDNPKTVTISIPADDSPESLSLRNSLKTGELFIGDGFTYSAEKNTKIGIHIFKVTHKIQTPTLPHEELKSIFEEITSPFEKLSYIGNELAETVTGIYGRPDLHVLLFLLFHSVYEIKYRGVKIPDSTLDFGIIGDTRTGKTVTFRGLAKFYGVGAVIDMKNASTPGILGSAQVIGKDGYKIIPGILQRMHQRGPILFDECKPEHSGILQSMATARSDGFVNIVKAGSQLVGGNAPLIFFYNPDEMLESSPGLGVEKFRRFFKRPEDVSRFDFVTSVTINEVPVSLILDSKLRNSVYRRELWRGLRNFCGNLRGDDFIFDEDFENNIGVAVETMTAKYSSSIPLITQSDFIYKLVKLAATVAASTYSVVETDEKVTEYVLREGEIQQEEVPKRKVVVTVQHLAAAIKLVYLWYDKPSFAYDQFSKRKKVESEPNKELCIEVFSSTFGEYTANVAQILYDNPFFSQATLGMVAPTDSQMVKKLVQIWSINGLWTVGQQGTVTITPKGSEVLLSIVGDVMPGNTDTPEQMQKQILKEMGM